MAASPSLPPGELSSAELAQCLIHEVLPVDVQRVCASGVPFDVAVRVVSANSPGQGVVLDGPGVTAFAESITLDVSDRPVDEAALVLALLVRARDGLYPGWSFEQALTLIRLFVATGELGMAPTLSGVLRAGTPEVALTAMSAGLSPEQVFTAVVLARRDFDVDDAVWLVRQGVTRSAAAVRDLRGFALVPDRLERRYATLLGASVGLPADMAHALVIALPVDALDLLVVLAASGTPLPDAVRSAVLESRLAARRVTVPRGASTGPNGPEVPLAGE